MNKFKIITILSLLIVTISIALYYCSFEEETNVVNGICDVQNNLSKQDVFSLDGSWEFYWTQLIEPNDFKTSTIPKASKILVPGKWNPSSGLSESGYGTYRLTLKKLEVGKEYGLLKKNIRIASKIFLDEKVIFQDGIPSNNPASEVMGNEPRLINFIPTHETVELIIQVSNFKYYSGGIVESIRFGTFEAAAREQKLQLIFEVVVSTYLLVITITLAILVVFFSEFRNKKVGSYFMPLTVLAFAIINGSLGQRLIKLFFHDLSTEMLIRIEYVAVGVLLITMTVSIHFIEKKLLGSWVTGIIVSIYFFITLAAIITDMNNHFIWDFITLVTIVVLPVIFIIALYRYIWSNDLSIEIEEHTLILMIIYLVNLYNLDVLIFTLGYKSDLNLAFLSAGVFGVVWFLLIIYRYSLTIKKNNELSIQLMESYYDVERNASASRSNEIAFLQAQIKPHFLFNSLSSIIGLCKNDPKRAHVLLLNLSGYLKHLFDIERETDYIQLDSELELIKTYVSIEKERFGDRFEFITDIDQKLSKIKIIPLLIQPLVENAIKHGALKGDRKGIVKLSITKEQQYILVSVVDNGPGINISKIERLLETESSVKPNRAGVGMKNIEDRLMLYYGEKLHFENMDEMGTTVWFKIDVSEEVLKVDSNDFSR